MLRKRLMMRLAAIAALIAIAVAIASIDGSRASMLFFFVGSSGSGSVGVNCGTGVIDASTGCPLPMLGI